MGDLCGTAYLRELEASNQCELMFVLNVNIENMGVFHEEVRAVRQVTDTVESLLQHIVNKIKKSIKTFKENQKANDDKEVEVNVSLKNYLSQSAIKSKMVLKNLINSSMRNIEFRILDQRYVVVINAPFVKEIKLPLILYANFTLQASRIQLLFADSKMCKYWWYKSKDKINWEKVASTPKYKPDNDDIDHYIKLVCVPRNNVLSGPPAEVISINKVEKMGDLPTCPFEERHKFTSHKLEHNNFRIVSYNVLSNRYAETNERFPHCSLQALAMDYRKQLITKELLGYQGDIMCLQEVDNLLYTSYYKEVFQNRGYMSFYHRKGNKIPEGLACFFKKSRFKKVDDHQIIYSNAIGKKMFLYLWNFVKKNTDLKDCFMRQLTSLQITVLKMNASGMNHYIIIGNTHLFYHPDAELVRIVQINVATTYLYNLSKKYAQNGDNSKTSVFLCGDFNSIPTSAVYEYIVNGKLDKTHDVFKNSRNNIGLFHKFQFESACGKPKYTNYTRDFKDCLDYIFIEKNKIKVNNVTPFPTEEELANFEGLPNDLYPSDHLALIADLEIVYIV